MREGLPLMFCAKMPPLTDGATGTCDETAERLSLLSRFSTESDTLDRLLIVGMLLHLRQTRQQETSDTFTDKARK